MREGVTLSKLSTILSKAREIYLTLEEGKLTEESVVYIFNSMKDKYFSKPPTDEQSWALWSIFKPLIGLKPTKDLVLGTCCRAAANLHLIKLGIEPPLWGGEKTKATMLCTGVSSLPSNRGKKRLCMELFCLQGAPAGLSFSVPVTANMLEYILGKKLGMSFKAYNCEAEEITGCIFSVDVEENSYETSISEYSATAKMQELNKKLADSRRHMLKCATPLLPCSACRKTKDACALAVWKGETK